MKQMQQHSPIHLMTSLTPVLMSGRQPLCVDPVDLGLRGVSVAEQTSYQCALTHPCKGAYMMLPQMSDGRCDPYRC